MWSARDHKPIRKTFRSLAEARAWRQESQVALRQGTLRAPSPTTLEQAAQEWIAGAQAGSIRTRSGDRYKPSALRSYEQALRTKLIPVLGTQRLGAVTTNRLQDLVDELGAAELSPSTIRNTILPLRAIYRRALNRGDVAINPTLKLALPAARGRREKIARPHEGAALISALPPRDRALWASALYGGLRLGELQALDWAHVDLNKNLIHVERSWDRVTGFIDPKSRSGKRRVPLTNTLRVHLLEHKLQQGNGGRGLLFLSTTGDRPFNPSTINKRARAAWETANLEPLTLHECRHTYSRSPSTATVTSYPATKTKQPPS